MPPEIIKGLKDVYFDTTKSSFIDGEVGKLLYRGYNIHDLAEKSTFEEVVYLLLYSKLPNTKELADFDAQLRANRIIPDGIIQVLDVVKASHPMDALRTGISALSAFDPEVNDNSVEATIRKGIRLTAMGPTIVAAHHRLRHGLEPVAPDAELDQAANLLYMLRGERPPVYEVEAMNVSLILYAEHGYNASAFTGRVVASTLADLYAAVTAAIGALAGPLHGGANEAVLNMLEEIGDAKNIPEYVDRAKKKDDPFRLMGFGHRVYKNFDPRAKVMEKICHEVLNDLKIKDEPLLDIAVELERIALKDDYFIEKKLYPNVDFYSGIIFKALGIPTSLFTVLFAVARTVGWVAQWNEMIEDPSQKIGRPRQLYIGETARKFKPLHKRI